MIDTLHQIDEIYRRDKNLAGKVSLAISGTNIFTSHDRTAGSSADAGVTSIPDFAGMTTEQTLAAYEGWLATGMSLKYADGAWRSDFDEIRGTGSPKALDSCLNHMFTHLDTKTGTLGVGQCLNNRRNGTSCCLMVHFKLLDQFTFVERR